MKKPPFNRFYESFSSIFPISFFTFSHLSFEIVNAGGNTVCGNPADVGKIVVGAAFDVVLDNNDKDLDIVRPVVDWAKNAGAKQFLFISKDAGHVVVEKYIGETFGSWDSFRKRKKSFFQIFYKWCLTLRVLFFACIVRNRSSPIPGSGMQLTNISHTRYLSYMLIVAIENPTAASGNIFNCVSDRAVTLDGMAKLCAQATGLPVEIVHYDPKAVGIDAKKEFPLRNVHFCAEPRAAKELLGWSSSTKLPEDLKERFEEYVKIGKDKK
ncbi:hypothetical protein MKX03_006748 [Papaver bracteatum]|nr:hypothetical protein MKX03_006748 [Papaver bracteatum]